MAYRWLVLVSVLGLSGCAADTGQPPGPGTVSVHLNGQVGASFGAHPR
jgi:hypothetical protein